MLAVAECGIRLRACFRDGFNIRCQFQVQFLKQLNRLFWRYAPCFYIVIIKRIQELVAPAWSEDLVRAVLYFANEMCKP